MDPTYSIVFVCMGNICRSPTAEAVMRHLLDEAGLADRVVVASAGTGGWHVGDGIDERAGAALRTAGYDGSRHRARQFARTWFDEYDLVVAMDRSNRHFLSELARDETHRSKIRLLRAYDPTAARRGELDVPDPYYEDAEGFAAVLVMVEAGCRGLLEEVRIVVDGAA